MTKKASGYEENMTGSVRKLLRDVMGFVKGASGLRVRGYQREAVKRIIDSVENHKGHTIVVIFPRQSGKNEMQAQIETYLLARYSNESLEMVKVSPTWKPQAQNAMRRLERALNQNPITHTLWRKEQGYIYRVGKARITFLSGSPTSKVVGATANLLLSCDEAQDIELAKWDREFNPMAAATNATKVFWGTAWTAETLLAREKRAARKEEAADGEQRVFEINADTVRMEVPEYGTYVDKEVAKMGRWHPMVRTQYFSEEMEAAVGMFPPERRRMMQGEHGALEEAEAGKMYAFLLDIGGSFSNLNDPGSFPSGNELEVSVEERSFTNVNDSRVVDKASHNSTLTSRKSERASGTGARAATALTIVEIDVETLYDEAVQAPRYLVRKRRMWQGTKHTELHAEIKRMTEAWNPKYLIIDATGVGAGLASFLEKAFPTKVVPFTFSAASKSKLGWDFLAVVETGRFINYCVIDSGVVGKSPHNSTNDIEQTEDRWPGEFERIQIRLQELFWRQVRGCEAEVRVGPGQVMKWGVPAGKRDPETNEVLHDDLVVSAALCAVLDKQVWGSGVSVVIEGEDIFKGLGEVF